jgi:hypothetical protein
VTAMLAADLIAANVLAATDSRDALCRVTALY